MELEQSHLNCQIPYLDLLSEGTAATIDVPLINRFKVSLRRHMRPTWERAFKAYSNNGMNWLCRMRGLPEKKGAGENRAFTMEIKAGDYVRVKPVAEILKTTNHWNQVKGCAFMPVMEKYCNTVQRVWKEMRRFVDERDFKIKKTNGIILLEDVICEGTEGHGRCDRACLHFWRKEWLEKIPDPVTRVEPIGKRHARQQPWVRVKSISEIEDDLKNGDEIGRRLFVPEMEKYCGTKHRLLKVMSRYLDEHDLRAKKTSGIVLLKGVMCAGQSDTHRCDRSCFYMWKKDWVVEI